MAAKSGQQGLPCAPPPSHPAGVGTWATGEVPGSFLDAEDERRAGNDLDNVWHCFYKGVKGKCIT